MTKKIFLYQISLGLFLSGGLFINEASRHLWLPTLLTTFLMSLNLMVLVWSLKKFLAKKSIALSMGLIVFKWLIIGACFYSLVVVLKMSPWGLVLGVSTLFPALILWIRDILKNESL